MSLAAVAAEKKYFVIFEGRELGPFSRGEIEGYIRNREVKSETLVRFEDSTQWFEAAKVFTSHFSNPADSLNNSLSNFNQSLSGSAGGNSATGQYPADALKWSWAAFLWGGIWAVGHRVWWGLLAFVPYVGFFAIIALGIFGRRQAWDNKCWHSVEHMNERGKFWVGLWFGLLAFFIVLGLGAVVLAAVLAK